MVQKIVAWAAQYFDPQVGAEAERRIGVVDLVEVNRVVAVPGIDHDALHHTGGDHPENPEQGGTSDIIVTNGEIPIGGVETDSNVGAGLAGPVNVREDAGCRVERKRSEGAGGAWRAEEGQRGDEQGKRRGDPVEGTPRIRQRA